MEEILSAVFFITVIWMIVIAVKKDEWVWAIGMFFIFPLMYIYGAVNWGDAKLPLLLNVGAIIMVGMSI